MRGERWGVEYTVYSGDVKKVVKQLNKLKNKTPNSLRNAVNRAATKSRNLLFKEAKAGYTLKDLAKEDIKIIRASPSRPIAEFKVHGSVRQMIEYEHTPNTPGRHGTGIRAKVLKNASMKELRRAKPGGAAFIGSGGRIAGKPAQRDRGDWGSIAKKEGILHGPSKPKIYEVLYKGTGESGQPAVEPKAREILITEIRKEIAKLTAK